MTRRLALVVVLVTACSSSYQEAPPDGGTAQPGPPKCDPERDATCLALPPGWSLVAISETAGASCPAGFDRPSDAGENPVPRADACDCTKCKVTQPAKCEGHLEVFFGNSQCADDDPNYPNVPAGTCLTGIYDGDFALFTQFGAPAAVPGSATCASDPVQADRVDWGARMRVCEDASRCSGGTCDAKLDAPFRACVANGVEGGDATCPSSFPTKRAVSANATFECATGCSCASSVTACTGTITHFKNADCTGGSVNVELDGICKSSPMGNQKWKAYRVNATATTTCQGTGTSAASNPRLVKPRTICCR